jgi:5'-nucleotidase
MRVLVTNDDGVGSPGLAALAAALADEGHELLIAAPLEDCSGSSSAIGPIAQSQGISYESVSLPGTPHLEALGVDGPPALIVLLARLGGFGQPPELVVSGINPGHNTGRSTLHSGTVGAALTAANFGISGLAVSTGFGEQIHWETAARLAAITTRWLIEAPKTTVVNLNVPNVAFDDLLGVRLAPLASFGTVRSAITDSGGGKLQVELRDTEVELDPDSDTALVARGIVAVTPIVGIRAAGDGEVAAFLGDELARLGEDWPPGVAASGS